MSESDENERRSPRHGRFGVLHLWSSTLAGVVALGISLYNLSTLHESPKIDATLPHLLRIGQGENVYLFLQPTISARHQTQDVEVVTSMQLDLWPDGQDNAAKRPRFFWDDSIVWKVNQKTAGLDYVHAEDPAPLVVNQDKPQQPIASFIAKDWNLTPGRYQGKLTLHRASRPEPLTEEFCLTISSDDLKEFTTPGNGTYFVFRNDDPESVDRHADCYARFRY
ncbi:hypothetical protein [Streptomyces sp. NPDC058644]|uniref:hypothetical protein n=1 Tax=unclassified Streptomyces TaxID=2593676 RepID=UPI00364EEC2F